MTQGPSVHQGVATLWCSKHDYTRTLRVVVVVVVVVDFRVVWLVTVAMAAARVCMSRATERMDGCWIDFVVVTTRNGG